MFLSFFEEIVEDSIIYINDCGRNHFDFACRVSLMATKWLTAQEMAAWRAFVLTAGDVIRAIERDLQPFDLDFGDFGLRNSLVFFELLLVGHLSEFSFFGRSIPIVIYDRLENVGTRNQG